MLRRAVLVAAVCGSLVVLQCGDETTDDPTLCDRLASAALKCTFSGFTDQTIDALRQACRENRQGAECAIDAYETSCGAYDQLLAAVKACE
jgi:hypothetical protein